MAKTHVIFSAGHRNKTGGGSAGEAALTLAYADAYARILPEKGFTVQYVQRLKPAKGKPDWYAGGGWETWRRRWRPSRSRSPRTPRW